MNEAVFQDALVEFGESLQRLGRATKQEEFEMARVQAHAALEKVFAWDKERRPWLDEQHAKIDAQPDPAALEEIRREAGLP